MPSCRSTDSTLKALPRGKLVTGIAQPSQTLVEIAAAREAARPCRESRRILPDGQNQMQASAGGG